jgi:pimeloyl-ACP methyl ester carboxylesterase
MRCNALLKRAGTRLDRWIVVAAAVFLILAGSGAKPRTTSRDPGTVGGPDGAQIEAGKFSAGTARLLRLYSLTRLATKDPLGAIPALDALLANESPSRRREIETAISEVAIREARQTKAKKAPETVLGLYLCAAHHAYRGVVEAARDKHGSAAIYDPGFGVALDVYNYAVARIVSRLQDPSGPRSYPAEIAGPLRGYILTWRDRDDGRWDRAEMRFAPVDALAVKGLENRYRTRGIGTPIVAVRLESAGEPEEVEGFFASYRYVYPLTAILRFRDPEGTDPVEVELTMLDPLAENTAEVAGATLPLGADYTASIAILREETDLSALGGVLRPEKRLDDIGLYIPEPYRPDKIPVVFVHGLVTDAMTWVEMFNDLRGDPELREHYQLWFFNYPTALPFPYAAMLLRRSLERIRAVENPEGDDLAFERMVIVGHSMGGLTTRLLVTRTDTALWDSIFSRSPEELTLTAAERELLEDMYFLEPLPFVSRVVFMATPHRGSRVASGAAGKMASPVVKLPDDLAATARSILETNASALTPEAGARTKVPTSIYMLSPESVVLQALDSIPIDPDVRYHSIMGDRGKGGGSSSSDGVVAYGSAHLEGAESETLVPSGHKVHKAQGGILEVRRILLEHLRQK